jgi:subtilisin family serine protease
MSLDRPVILLASTLIAIPAGHSLAQSADGAGETSSSSAALTKGSPIPVSVQPRHIADGREVEVIVRLTEPSLAELAARPVDPVAQSTLRSHVVALEFIQDTLLERVQTLGGVPIARLTKALNAIVIRVDAAQIPAIARMPGVVSVRPVGRYELHLDETVPYIGAQAVQDLGVDGTGVRVAVLDSGIDYLHQNLGGSGDKAEYDANDPTIIETGTFPTAKVVGGYDFVGNQWPNSVETPDPDPLDDGPGGGHGTHVADIIAGRSVDDLHRGVAPGASLYAVKVCSSVSSACSGLALLQGMEFALDPDGDDDLSDRVDVINLSLGSSYGQREDDLSAACANAVELGVVVVASAGNNSNKPYILGSPSSTPEVISVAQTQVPSAALYRIESGATSVGGSWQGWSDTPATVEAQLQYGAGTNLLGCDAFDADAFTGKIGLVDRGDCAISIKVSNIAAAGGLAAIVANNVAQPPGDLPPDFGFGGGTPSVPGYSITLADGDVLKALAGQTVVIDPANAAALVGNMVSSSSRGPNIGFSAIKPDIGAPGASVSAEYGTGTETTAFGGTSGAAPMVAGAAALVLQAEPGLKPHEVKARLMNSAENAIGINPVALPDYPAPITRIGGGEVRVNLAYATESAAWESKTKTGSLSFGFQAVTTAQTFERRVTVHNASTRARTYRVTSDFRYPDDAASRAVTLYTPATVRVAAGSTAEFPVRLRVIPYRLPAWTMSGGDKGASGHLLDAVEYDGYLTIADDQETLSMPWHILPRHSAAVRAYPNRLFLGPRGRGLVVLANLGSSLNGRVEIFALTGTSPEIPKDQLPKDGDNRAVVDLAMVGVRVVDDRLAIGITTFGERSTPLYPAEFDIHLDIDRDGVADFVIFNAELSFGSGLSQIFVYDASSKQTFWYGDYTDADLNSANMIMSVPLSAVGMASETQFDYSVYAFDGYFSGLQTDAIEGMTFTGSLPRYLAGTHQISVPPSWLGLLDVTSIPDGQTASPSQTGLLLLYRDARIGAEAQGIKVVR